MLNCGNFEIFRVYEEIIRRILCGGEVFGLLLLPHHNTTVPADHLVCLLANQLFL